MYDMLERVDQLNRIVVHNNSKIYNFSMIQKSKLIRGFIQVI